MNGERMINAKQSAVMDEAQMSCNVSQKNGLCWIQTRVGSCRIEDESEHRFGNAEEFHDVNEIAAGKDVRFEYRFGPVQMIDRQAL